MATQSLISSNPVRHNGTTIVYGGSTGVATNVPGLNLVGNHAGLINKVPDAGTDNDKLLSAGSYAKLVSGRYIIMRATAYIANIANNVLGSGAGEFHRKSVAFVETIKTTKMVTAGWNYVTGAFLTTPDVNTDSLGRDDAARATRAIPGEFVIVETGKTPSQKDYSAKTG